MIHDLDSSLKAILSDASTSVLVRNADVEFTAPVESYSPAAPTINLFLYDIRECTDLRSNEPVVERQGGMVTMHRPAPRVECAYLVTAWSGSGATGEAAVLKQHELLGAAMRVFAGTPFIPGSLLQGSLVAQPFPVPLVTLPVAVARNPFEFWSAIGGKLRPSFTLTATIALELEAQSVIAFQVTNKKIDLKGTEPVFQIGGTVREKATAPALGAAINDVELALVELGLHARSDLAGQFSFSGMPEGTYELKARKQGYVTASRQVQVPGDSPTAFNLQLSP